MNFAMAVAGASAGTAAKESAVANTAGSAEHSKLTDAAQQFEGMLLQEMLKPMKERGFCTGDGDDESDSKDGGRFADTLSSYGTEAMATAIAKGGGLGIAKRVVEQVEGEKAAHDQANAGKGIEFPK